MKGIIIVLCLIFITGIAYAQTPNPDNPNGPVAASVPANYADWNEQHKKGYNDGYDRKAPRHANTDYYDGWDAGWDDKEKGLPNRVQHEEEKKKEGKKKGGKDPLVTNFEGYWENDGYQCKSEYYFDYENNGVPINFCYNIIGDIFVIDFGYGINSGYNMLQFVNTSLDAMTPYEFLQKYYWICDYADCYLWNDKNRDWTAQPKELKDYDIAIFGVMQHTQGLKHENGRYVYCTTMSYDSVLFYCVKPTYWSYT